MSAYEPDRFIPKWLYLNAALHEVGHAVFGFGHVTEGTSAMWARNAYAGPAGFDQHQRNIIMKSKWGH